MSSFRRYAHRFSVIAMLGYCFVAVSTLKAEPETPSKVGAAAVDITPTEFPINMPGGFNANYATSIHDPFHARTIVFDDGAVAVSLTVVDNLGVAPEVIEKAKSLASEKTGIPAERMLVCSTHTHSGPPSNAQEGPAASYPPILVSGIAQSIADAYAARQPASVGFGVDQLAEEVFNRRWFLKPGKMQLNPFGEMDQVRMNPPRSPGFLDRPAAPTDPDISVISVLDANRKPLAMFANYALHYVGATPRGQLSADYFGEFARLMPNRLRAGDGFVAMMSNAASGDINNIPFTVNRPPREPFEQVRIVARKAADTAWSAHQSIGTFQSDFVVGMRQRVVTLKYRRPSESQVAYAEKVIATKDDNERKKLPRLADAYARRTLNAADRSDETVDVVVQAMRIGDVAICGLPFETLVEIGLELKKDSPFSNTVVIGLANGRYGYLPTPEQHRLGGYETWLGTCWVQEDASTIVVDHLQEMLAELRG